MAETAVAKKDGRLVEQVVLHGDLAELSPADRVAYYARVCDSLGLNPFTRPFEYIRLNNKLTLYARRDATDQLRSLKGVSITITNRELMDGVYVVTAMATMGKRTDESTGAVDISNLKGDFRANAMMKAETKAKRRVTLSIVGLGWMDETEVGDISPRDARKVDVNLETGEIQSETPARAAPEPEALPEVMDEEPEQMFDEPAPVNPITLEWLRESLNTLQWADVGKYLREHYGVNGATVRLMIEALTPDQRQEFVDEVQRRVEQKG